MEFDEIIASAIREMEKRKLHYNEQKLRAVAKHLGAAAYDPDASLVACTDDRERETVKRNFLIDTLGLEDGEYLDKAIEQACMTMGESNRHKNRIVFYYLLMQIFQKEKALD